MNPMSIDQELVFDSKRISAILIVTLFLLSGCLSSETEVENPSIVEQGEEIESDISPETEIEEEIGISLPNNPHCDD